MKTGLLHALLSTLAICSLPAAPPEKPSAAKPVKGPAEAADFSRFKTADEFWDHIAKIGAETPPEAKSRDEFIQILHSWLGRQHTAAAAFVKKYPDDARCWDAKVVMLMTANQLQQFGGPPVDTTASRKEIDAILAAPEATPEAKSEASYLRVQLLAEIADPENPETSAPLQKAVTEFLDRYAGSKRSPEIAAMQVDLLRSSVSPEADNILKKLAASKNEEIAALAKGTIEQRARMARLKTNPVELKFTATNGQDVDLEKLRGKVVLIDFWASWCGPCIAEMPTVVSAYEKLHKKGFEIVGISLDEDKAAMEAALKKHSMSWVQFFDGKGWENKISQSFGIDSIPAAWLVDKKGLLRETELRGEELAKGVEKLLAE